jgi:hypothetical protein
VTFEIRIHGRGGQGVVTAAELLAAAAQRDLPMLDEKLYFDVFAQPTAQQVRRVARKGAQPERQSL